MSLDLGALQSDGLDLGALESTPPVLLSFGVDGAGSIGFDPAQRATGELDLGALESGGLDLGAIESAPTPAGVLVFRVDGSTAVSFDPAQESTSQTGTFTVDGAGSIYFEPRDDEPAWLRVDGAGEYFWIALQNETATGFTVPGAATVEWNFGNTFRVPGAGSITFTAENGPAQTGFRVDGIGGIEFNLPGGVSGECMSPGNAYDAFDTTPVNYVF